MTARIVGWTTIMFFVVSPACSSSVFEKNNNPVCYKNVSYQHYSLITYREVRDEPIWWIFKTKEFLLKTKYENRTEWRTETTCCPHYENKTGICKCNDYWDGELCNDPLFCIITQPAPVNVSQTATKPPLENGTENVMDRPQIGWNELSECLPECLDQLNKGIFKNTRSGNVTYYLVPIDSSCQTAATLSGVWMTYRYFIVGGGIGIIILFLMVVCIVCIVRKNRRSSETIDHELLEPEYDYVEIKRISS